MPGALPTKLARSTLPVCESFKKLRDFLDFVETSEWRTGEGNGAKAGSNRRGKFMKLVIERGELLRALGHVTSVVERRTTIPILSNVLLKASDRALQFKATDLEREV
jgi:hypothetical protein